MFMGQYWNQVTYGQVVVRTQVTNSVYRLPETQAYYGNDALFAERQTIFLRDAVQAADPDYHLPDFDVQIAVHAGNGQEADVSGDSPEQLWSVFAPFDVLQAYLPDSTASQGIATDDLGDDGEPYFVKFALVLPELESQDYDTNFEPRGPTSSGSPASMPTSSGTRSGSRTSTTRRRATSPIRRGSAPSTSWPTAPGTRTASCRRGRRPGACSISESSIPRS